MASRGAVATAVANSDNRKIGDAAATYAAQVSCPEECPFYNGGGCYAESGALGNFVTAPLNRAAQVTGASLVDVAKAEAKAIDGLSIPSGPVGRPLRLHGVGDCKTDEAARIVSAAAERYMERGGGPVWTYTHAWRTVARASWGGVSVLASCETPLDVELARARGYAPSIVVGSFPTTKLYRIEESAPDPECVQQASLVRGANGLASAGNEAGLGADVLPCPAQTHDDVTCASCRLCFDDKAILERGYAIGFAIHGTALAVKKARLALAAPDDPRRKLTSRDFIVAHIAKHGEWPTPRKVMDGADVCHSSATEMLARMRAEQRKAA